MVAAAPLSLGPSPAPLFGRSADRGLGERAGMVRGRSSASPTAASPAAASPTAASQRAALASNPAIENQAKALDLAVQAWSQCLRLHEEILGAVREEQQFRKDWTQQLQQTLCFEVRQQLMQQHTSLTQEWGSEQLSGQMQQQLDDQSVLLMKQLASQHNLLTQSIEAAFKTNGDASSVPSGGRPPVILPQEAIPSKTLQNADSKPQAFSRETAGPALGETAQGLNSPKVNAKGLAFARALSSGSADGSDDQVIADLQDSREPRKWINYIRNGDVDMNDGSGEADDVVDWHVQVLDRRLNKDKSGMQMCWTTVVNMLGCGTWASYIPTDEPRNLLSTVLSSSSFTVGLITIILLNTLFIGVQTHLMLVDLLDGGDAKLPVWVTMLNLIFIVFFFIEIMLRIIGHRAWFIFGTDWKWNFFDVTLLLLACITESDNGVSLFSSARALRVFQVARVFRIIRIVRFFSKLRLMLLSIFNALHSLFWAFALLVLIMFVFSIAIMQTLVHHLEETLADGRTISDLKKWYGTLPLTMYSLMRAISGGADWGDMVSPLADISQWYQVMFTLYVVFVVFGVLNVLTGVFVQTAGEIIDRDLIVESEEARAEGFMKEMKSLFDEFDTDKTGKLSWTKFHTYIKKEKVQAYLSARGLDCSDASTLFKLLAQDANEEVDIMKFILGCIRLRGNARSIDLMVLRMELQTVEAEVQLLLRNNGVSRSQRFAVTAKPYSSPTGSHMVHCNGLVEPGQTQAAAQALAVVEEDDGEVAL